MRHDLRARLVPPQQRRTLDELTDDLVLRDGDRRSKTTAFWTMLALSSVIACAGVLTDSTATAPVALVVLMLRVNSSDVTTCEPGLASNR